MVGSCYPHLLPINIEKQLESLSILARIITNSALSANDTYVQVNKNILRSS